MLTAFQHVQCSIDFENGNLDLFDVKGSPLSKIGQESSNVMRSSLSALLLILPPFTNTLCWVGHPTFC